MSENDIANDDRRESLLVHHSNAKAPPNNAGVRGKGQHSHWPMLNVVSDVKANVNGHLLNYTVESLKNE